jgi:DNA-binding CsgD family transcriptional regulator/pimeloyl-ACP methyl ester carboxylesterase
MDAPPVQYVTTSDGYNIAYAVAGSGTAVVYVPMLHQHFSLFWSTVRGPALSALAERFKLYVYDGRGQGSSTRGLSSSLTIDDLEVDLKTVVDRVSEPRFVLYGPGPFGQVAIRYAAHHPERVKALVLWNYIDTPLAAYARGLRELAVADWDAYLDNQARASWYAWDPQLMVRLLRETATQNDHVTLQRTLRATSAEDVLGQLAMPTLILATRAGQRMGQNEESGRRLAGMIAGAQLRLMDNNGLNPEGDRPPGSVTAIEDFLRGLTPAATSPPDGVLSSREIEVLRLVGHGLNNQQIADELVISVNTVRRHVSNIFDKTGVANRAQAVAYARDHGLV